MQKAYLEGTSINDPSSSKPGQMGKQEGQELNRISVSTIWKCIFLSKPFLYNWNRKGYISQHMRVLKRDFVPLLKDFYIKPVLTSAIKKTIQCTLGMRASGTSQYDRDQLWQSSTIASSPCILTVYYYLVTSYFT